MIEMEKLTNVSNVLVNMRENVTVIAHTPPCLQMPRRRGEG